MDYHSAIKRREILINATVQMNLENIIPSEEASHKIILSNSICMFRIGRSIETESR